MSLKTNEIPESNSNEYLKNEAAVIKAIGHFVRLKLLLAIEMKKCMVKGLVGCVDEEQPIVSQQLAVLRKWKIVEGIKKGNTIYYRIIDPTVKQIVSMLAEKYKKS
ncbi:MAG: metalloregulator ArsR/SmtB family transcription factor [Candidatus Delongbacteria bacterium]|jgi:DNA-binding transcriptional ArsR family regulator|nr:metalloregulator ArsR/SmtB family transcription factor [Candidatus Delongbacteria bacterium]MDD4206004.1 metalloregulator ArsR/SmtB family transcription factor [Candidatus Delongbacteria bacterium]MDY0017587.1 metalloregulator ArsR/SmtB family transcription factor [Candidatus Delongbacteria bacterium]